MRLQIYMYIYKIFKILNNCNFKQLKQDFFYRNDEKTAQDYKVQGGSVLHLVLALRGGY